MSLLLTPIVVAAISAYILYWVIRSAVSGGMKDFERWKREQDRAS